MFVGIMLMILLGIGPQYAGIYCDFLILETPCRVISLFKAYSISKAIPYTKVVPNSRYSYHLAKTEAAATMLFLKCIIPLL